MPSTTTETALYLYGITKANSPAADLPGIDEAAVEKVVEGGLGAIVSRITATHIRPRRANLSAHHQVVSSLAARDTVLPVTFGTVAGSAEELRTLLRRNHDALLALLERLEGKVEMGLKVYWATPNVFEYFVANHQELATLRDRLFRAGRNPTREQKIELGQFFASLLAQSRERHTQRVVKALSPYCEEIRATEPGEERMVMKLACLVERDHQKMWEEGITRVAQLFDDHYCFACSGPFAPHGFAEVDLTCS